MKILIILLSIFLVTLSSQTTYESGTFFGDKSKSGYQLHTGDGLRTFEVPVKFASKFDSKPKVMVTVTLLDAEQETQLRYSAEPFGVSRDGFTLKVSTWGGTRINGIGGYWLAEAEVLKLEEEEIKVGETIQLNNITFEYNKATLKSDSYEELDKVADYLANNSSVEIELSGHTDDVGSDEFNLKLSQERADAVVAYLVSKGIDASRLTAKGYGKSKPIASNSTEYGREQNRRVEFTVLKK